MFHTIHQVDEAEEFCREWRSYGHLVSIMNEAESKEVGLYELTLNFSHR